MAWGIVTRNQPEASTRLTLIRHAHVDTGRSPSMPAAQRQRGEARPSASNNARRHGPSRPAPGPGCLSLNGRVPPHSPSLKTPARWGRRHDGILRVCDRLRLPSPCPPTASSRAAGFPRGKDNAPLPSNHCPTPGRQAGASRPAITPRKWQPHAAGGPEVP